MKSKTIKSEEFLFHRVSQDIQNYKALKALEAETDLDKEEIEKEYTI